MLHWLIVSTARPKARASAVRRHDSKRPRRQLGRLDRALTCLTSGKTLHLIAGSQSVHGILEHCFPHICPGSQRWTRTCTGWRAWMTFSPFPANSPTRQILMANWIKAHIEKPIIYGPDEESEQWVRTIAEACDAPYDVFQKMRLGDKNVQDRRPRRRRLRRLTPLSSWTTSYHPAQRWRRLSAPFARVDSHAHMLRCTRHFRGGRL
jgi:hypothetical protein